MEDLLTQMEQCTSVQACIELAIMDAYGEDEQAAGWQACLETIFEGIEQACVLGKEVSLEGFDIAGGCSVVAICRKGNKTAKVTPDSLEFPKATKAQSLWFKAWRERSRA